MKDAISITEMLAILREAKLDASVQRQIIEQAQTRIKLREGSGDEKTPSVKKQYVVLVSDPNEVLKDVDLAGWILQIPEDVSASIAEERICKTVYSYNATKKGRLHPVQTIGEAIEFIKGPQFKENEVWVKTKTPILIVRTSNEVPGVDTIFGKGGAK